MQVKNSRRIRRVQAALSVVGVGLAALGCGTTGSGLSADDTELQAAACRQVSPGGELAVGTALRGRLVKAAWSFSECTLSQSGGNESITLIARNSKDGYVQGDSNALVKVIFSNNAGPIEPAAYLDAAPSSNQQHSFQVFASSSPSVNCSPLFNGTGTATIDSYKVNGTRVTLHATFTLKVFEYYTATVLDFCGEANFDGPVTITGS